MTSTSNRRCVWHRFVLASAIAASTLGWHAGAHAEATAAAPAAQSTSEGGVVALTLWALGGAAMGGLAAAAGFGQMLGSSVGGWGALAQRSFGWLALPLALMRILVLARPGWWSVIPAESTRHLARLATKGRHD